MHLCQKLYLFPAAEETSQSSLDHSPPIQIGLQSGGGNPLAAGGVWSLCVLLWASASMARKREPGFGEDMQNPINLWHNLGVAGYV